MESTYGGRKHELAARTSERICEIIRAALEKRGQGHHPLPSPCERTQQLLYTLDKLNHEGRIPHIATFVDSPLAVDATKISSVCTWTA